MTALAMLLKNRQHVPIKSRRVGGTRRGRRTTVDERQDDSTQKGKNPGPPR